MSVKVQIKKEQLDKLNKSQIESIFNNHELEFTKKRYLKERYERKDAFIKLITETDDKEIDVSVALESILIDTAAGYGLNNPVTYYDKSDDNFEIEKRKNVMTNLEVEYVTKKNESKKNKYLEELLKVLSRNNTSRNDVVLLKNVLLYGSSDEAIFTNENSEIEIIEIEDDCIAFYDHTIKPKMIGFARRYDYTDGITQETYTKYELYLEDTAWQFDERESERQTLEYGNDVVTGIPFIRYDIGIPYIQNLISQIRSYELVTNNTKNTLAYNDEAILMIQGYMFDNSGTEETEDQKRETVNNVVKMFKESGAMFLDGEDGDAKAEYLIKDINDTATENHKKNLKDDLYNIAGTFNSANDNQVYQNTLSLIFKMYGLETKMGGYIMEIKKGFMERIRIITKILNYPTGEDFDYTNIDMSFSRDLPTNVNEEINFANQMKDILPLETIYEHLSFIENPKKEIKRYKEWKMEVAQLNKETMLITASATSNEMNPTSAEDYKNENEKSDE